MSTIGAIPSTVCAVMYIQLVAVVVVVVTVVVVVVVVATTSNPCGGGWPTDDTSLSEMSYQCMCGWDWQECCLYYSNWTINLQVLRCFDHWCISSICCKVLHQWSWMETEPARHEMNRPNDLPTRPVHYHPTTIMLVHRSNGMILLEAWIWQGQTTLKSWQEAKIRKICTKLRLDYRSLRSSRS